MNKNYIVHYKRADKSYFAVISAQNEIHAEALLIVEQPDATKLSTDLLREQPNYSGWIIGGLNK